MTNIRKSNSHSLAARVRSSELRLARPRLLRLLSEPALAPITLITAPAGFGKSTLAAQWTNRATHQVAWVSLRPASNSPQRFLAELASSLRETSEPAEWPEAEISLDDIIRSLEDRPAIEPVTVIFDDYHLIENADIHQMLNSMIANLAPAVSLMIVSRTVPPLAIARLRIDGSVREITATELRIHSEDASALLEAFGHSTLTEEQIDRLIDRTDGWIAGLRLALLAIREAGGAADANIDTLSAQRWLDDYIVEEVLTALPNELRAFVLRTSFLDFLDPAFCDAVLELETSSRLIDEIARRLIFVKRDAHHTMTYHSLFAECVQ